MSQTYRAENDNADIETTTISLFEYRAHV